MCEVSKNRTDECLRMLTSPYKRDNGRCRRRSKVMQRAPTGVFCITFDLLKLSHFLSVNYCVRWTFKVVRVYWNPEKSYVNLLFCR